jgi:hypothetical protein
MPASRIGLVHPPVQASIISSYPSSPVTPRASQACTHGAARPCLTAVSRPRCRTPMRLRHSQLMAPVTTSGPPLNDLAPQFAPQRHWTPHGGRCKRAGQRGYGRDLQPDWNCPTSVRQRHTDSDLGFFFRVERRTFSLRRKRSPDWWAKNPPDLGAPLRNRTVDLLLTMDHQTVPVSTVEASSRQNTSSR